MENNFEKMIDIIIAIIIFFVFPFMYFSQRQDTITQQVVSTEVNNFVSTVNSHGIITKNMYNDLLDKLANTHSIYDIKLEHKKLALEPEYRFRTADEIIDEQNKAYNGTNTYHYIPVSTNPPVVYDPIDNSGLVMNTETNESILARAVRTPSPSGHIHTADCYVGGHTHSNNFIINGHVHSESCYCPGHIKIVNWSNGYTGGVYGICDNCGQRYDDLTGITEGQRCKRIVCGAVNGEVANCYSPKTYFKVNSSTVTLYCSECGQEMYTFGLYGYGANEHFILTFGPGTEVYNKVDIPCNSPSYTQIKSDFNNFCLWLFQFMGSASSWDPGVSAYAYDGVIPTTKLTCTIPYIGYLQGCPVCNDFKIIHGDSINVLYLYCMKSKKIILSTNYNSFYHSYEISYYTHGILNGEMVRNADAEVLYNRMNSIYLYGTTNCKKCYHTDGFAGGTVTDVWPIFTTFSIDEPLLSSLLVAPYIDGTLHYGEYTYCGIEGELKCSEIVKSIVATNPVQTVYVGEPLITTAKATYQDGSTGVVICSADFIPSSVVKDKNVMLSYVNIKNQTLTCTMKVTVIPKNKICVNGHLYNLNNDGTDPGCPYCLAWLKSLVIFNPAGSSLTIYRGTTLKENGVVLYATYFDGHTEYVETGYLDNLDKYYVGTQNVTISYKGKNVNLSVITKRNIVQCLVCHHYYELYPDDTDPGCPYCKARTPIFTGNVLKYYSECYQDEILKELYEGSGTYYFKAGDYFSVKLSNKTKTLGTKILGFVLHDLPKTSIFVECGGTVREDMDEIH